MTPFTTVTGVAAALPLANIDTDVIAPIQVVAAGGHNADLFPFALRPLRFHDDGSEKVDFVLNRPERRGAPILIAGTNFGCGSSREVAVTALMALGIRCVIADSFGDIFYANCFQNGVLPVVLPTADVAALMACAHETTAPFTVDLERQAVRSPDGAEYGFRVDERRRAAMLRGLDDIGLTLTDSEAIGAWQSRDRDVRPWIWDLPEIGYASKMSGQVAQ